ncbi:hypothetical protein GS597_14930 [Synechococcales cyanobacterium C]|uniref:Yip1 domain-containing protein n=1 Tax=Petrachloros mirabilis ULC683 TaxID=2781853 RepID=A0A8K2A953_9CYAN|nr:Yip1 family protein [Petrachloros mirabilis]NCJ07780.1 hypothetical protein [Petrachloros mirabilis ULC683]
MLDTLYTSFFRPTQVRAPLVSALIIASLVILVMALNAAGALSLGSGGVILFAILFAIGGLLGWFWLSAALHLVASVLGGHGSGAATLMAVARSLWPLLLSGPAIAAAQWSASLASLLSLAVTALTLVMLILSLEQVHQFGRLKALLCLGVALALSMYSLLGLILWPLMTLLGT